MSTACSARGVGPRAWSITGHNRTINRQKLDRDALERELADPESLRHQVFAAYRRLLRARASDAAFHPHGAQRVLSAGEGVFALLRTSPDGRSRVLCAHNVSAREQIWQVRPAELGTAPGTWRDLLTGEDVAAWPGWRPPLPATLRHTLAQSLGLPS